MWVGRSLFINRGRIQVVHQPACKNTYGAFRPTEPPRGLEGNFWTVLPNAVSDSYSSIKSQSWNRGVLSSCQSKNGSTLRTVPSAVRCDTPSTAVSELTPLDGHTERTGPSYESSTKSDGATFEGCTSTERAACNRDREKFAHPRERASNVTAVQ